MDYVMLAMLEIFKSMAKYSIAWALGIRAYRYVVNAITGTSDKL